MVDDFRRRIFCFAKIFGGEGKKGGRAEKRTVSGTLTPTHYPRQVV